MRLDGFRATRVNTAFLIRRCHTNVSLPPSHLLPHEVLLDLLPASFEPWGSRDVNAASPPTDASLQRIASELGIFIPLLFTEIARVCPAYGGWFGSIGNDFASHNHILSINQTFRGLGLTSRYVLLNHGYDGDCDAWDLEAKRSPNGEMPIVYFDFNSDRRELRSLRPMAATFAEYIDGFVRAHAPRCPVKRLRRRAKRILEAYRGTIT